MTKKQIQKPPKSLGSITGFPYGDWWEEFAPECERLYAHGTERALIDENFERVRLLDQRFYLTPGELEAILEPLLLSSEQTQKLAEELYYLAGHFLGPAFRRLFKESAADARKKMLRIEAMAQKLHDLLNSLSFAEAKYMSAARMALGEDRKGDPRFPFPLLMSAVADVAGAACLVAKEMPQLKRGTSKDVLLGRWLRQSVDVLEGATGREIEVRTSDPEGRKNRFVNSDGEVLHAYYRRVARGHAPETTVVQAVRDFHEHGLAGPAG